MLSRYCFSCNRTRIGFRSAHFGFVWYPGRRCRKPGIDRDSAVVYSWLKIGPWLFGNYGLPEGTICEAGS